MEALILSQVIYTLHLNEYITPSDRKILINIIHISNISFLGFPKKLQIFRNPI